jgi:hypothetical protein
MNTKLLLGAACSVLFRPQPYSHTQRRRAQEKVTDEQYNTR